MVNNITHDENMNKKKSNNNTINPLELARSKTSFLLNIAQLST